MDIPPACSAVPPMTNCSPDDVVMSMVVSSFLEMPVLPGYPLTWGSVALPLSLMLPAFV